MKLLAAVMQQNKGMIASVVANKISEKNHLILPHNFDPWLILPHALSCVDGCLGSCFGWERKKFEENFFVEFLADSLCLAA